VAECAAQRDAELETARGGEAGGRRRAEVAPEDGEVVQLAAADFEADADAGAAAGHKSWVVVYAQAPRQVWPGTPPPPPPPPPRARLPPFPSSGLRRPLLFACLSVVPCLGNIAAWLADPSVPLLSPLPPLAFPVPEAAADTSTPTPLGSPTP
jgi:hypothetical protein